VLQDFIVGQNVDHYLSLLMKPDVEPDKQLTLQRLLVEEQGKAPRNREQLELADRRIRLCKDHVRKLKNGSAELNADDPSSRRDMTVIATLQAVQGELETFYRALRDELEPYVGMLRNTAVAIFRTFDEARASAQRFANANPELEVMIIDRSTGDSHGVRAE
jgi:hypothetical protein